MAHVLKHSPQVRIENFSPTATTKGNIARRELTWPSVRFSRSPHGTFPEYHTSADNLDFCHQKLSESPSQRVLSSVRLEGNRTFLNLSPKCEPQLGKRGLYRMVGGIATPG